MDRDSVIASLRENIHRVVELHFEDGEIQTGSIISVDDEGVVYDLIASNREMPNASTAAEFWTTFDEINAVLPSASGRKA
jgi:hypothetical protein